ncbi:MAG: flagellar hook protein FlgE [Nitrospiraceae bacterium]
MGILTSMFTAVSGLNAYGNAMGIIGNNIANVGTAGFKGSRPAFADLVSSSLVGASGSSQGLGVFLADVQGVFTQGSLTTTGQTLDMAIDGNGFFEVRDASGAQFFTRNGQFKLDRQGQVIDATGNLLQGYQATSAGVLTNTIGNITLQTSNISPRATTQAAITANLNSAATVPTGAFNAADPTTYNFSTSTTIFDSLGNSHNLQLFFVKSATANTWAVHQRLDTGATAAIAGGVTFTTAGALATGGTQNLSLTMPGGAATPQAVTVTLSGLTQYAAQSALLSQSQDGFTSGALAGFGIDSTGQVTAQYTNGRNLLLAQVALSRFPNPQGLDRDGKNLFVETTDSGTSVQGAPGNNGLGHVISGAIERSNVDLGEQFVDMIITQRAFQANSRAITTSDEMLQELVNLKR